MKIAKFFLIIISLGFSQPYTIGDEVSMEHLLTKFEVCYGDYPGDSLSLVDFNGTLNGGIYGVTFIAIQNGG